MKRALSLVVWLLLAACQRDVVVTLELQGMARGDVMLEVKEVGPMPRATLEQRVRYGDLDGHSLLDDEECGGACRAIEVTLFIANKGEARMAPPVVRLSSPPGRPARAPVAFTAHEISPERAGRVRVLVSLWPEERALVVRPSPSVFFEVTSPDDAARHDEENPVDASANPDHRDTASSTQR